VIKLGIIDFFNRLRFRKVILAVALGFSLLGTSREIKADYSRETASLIQIGKNDYSKIKEKKDWSTEDKETMGKRFSDIAEAIAKDILKQVRERRWIDLKKMQKSMNDFYQLAYDFRVMDSLRFVAAANDAIDREFKSANAETEDNTKLPVGNFTYQGHGFVGLCTITYRGNQPVIRWAEEGFITRADWEKAKQGKPKECNDIAERMRAQKL